MSLGGGWEAQGGGGGAYGVDLQRLTSDIIAHFAAKKSGRKAEKFWKHRYQYMVNDLKAAGLNPMLAYGGMGGSMPDFPYATGGGGAQLGPSGPTSALQAAEKAATNQRLRNLQAEESNIRKMGGLIDAQIDETWSRSGQNAASTARFQAETRATDFARQVREALLPYDLKEAQQRGTAADLESQFLRDLGEAYPWLRRLLPLAGAAGAAGAAAKMRSRGTGKNVPPPAHVQPRPSYHPPVNRFRR